MDTTRVSTREDSPRVFGLRGLRVAFVITRSAPLGGAQVHVRDLAIRLKGEGADPVVVVGGMPAESNLFTQALLELGIQVVTTPWLIQPIRPLSDLKALIELRRILRAINPDLVSLHSSKAGLIGRVAAFTIGLPTIFTAHGWSFADGIPPRRAAAYRLIERVAARFTKSIITVSDADYELAKTGHISKSTSLMRIHNGMPDVDCSLRAEARSQPARLVMVARMQEQKDHRTLFLALSRMLDLEWTLDLVGDGPLRGPTEELARSLGISDRTNFSGEHPDVASRLREANLFLLISKWEGFPRSILEAMRAGLPVIASDVGGCREAVLEGKTGYLIRRGDVDQLEICLRGMIENPDKRGKLGSAGRERFLNEFTFNRMFVETTSIYADVLRKSVG